MSHLKYLRYLLRHKWFVVVAGLRCGVSIWRLLIHDWSKFLPCEWFPYTAYFYGEKVRLQCDRAWLHHQHLNAHHWQHWMLREDSGRVKLLEMPEQVWREMVADWLGAGRAITGKWEAAEWYAKNREIIQLAPETREGVEALLAHKPML